MPIDALVPAFVGEHVAALLRRALRPCLDRLNGLTNDPLFDGLTVTIELLEPARQVARIAFVSDIRSSSAISGRQSLPAALMRGASRKPTAPSSTSQGQRAPSA